MKTHLILILTLMTQLALATADGSGVQTFAASDLRVIGATKADSSGVNIDLRRESTGEVVGHAVENLHMSEADKALLEFQLIKGGLQS